MLRGYEKNNFVGVKLGDGYQLDWFIYVYHTLREHLGISEHDYTFEDFLEEVERRGMHVSDKKNWEASTKLSTALLYAVVVSMHIDLSNTSAEMLDYLWRSYLTPFVAYTVTEHKAYGFLKPGFTLSGHYHTLDGNSFRHDSYKVLFLVRNQSYFYTDDEAKLFEAILFLLAAVVGDDYKAIQNALARIYDIFTDSDLGSTTKCEYDSPLYAEVDEETGFVLGGHDFLQRSCVKKYDINGFAYPAYFRCFKRLLARFYYREVSSLINLASSAVSSAYNAGHNKIAYDFFANAYERAKELHGGADFDELVQDELSLDSEFHYQDEINSGFPTFSKVTDYHLPRPQNFLAASLKVQNNFRYRIPLEAN
jgi:hypothetical protein